jgi:hypothetical protein
MPTPITETTVEFTYKIADTLYAATDLDNRTASASYTGPDRTWIFVDEDTGRWNRVYPPLTSQEDGDSVPVPIGTKRIEIVAVDNPMIIALIYENKVTYADVSKITEVLPNGSTVEYNAVAELGETHNVDGLTYNFETNSWNTLAYVDSTITWDDVLNHRNGALTGSDGKISPDMPTAVKEPWLTFRQALRDLPSTFGYGTDSEVDAWKVQFPTHPGE